MYHIKMKFGTVIVKMFLFIAMEKIQHML